MQAAIVDAFPRVFEADEDFVISKRTQLKREISELLGEDGILLFPSLPRPYYYHNEPLFSPFDFVYAGIWNGGFFE
jgi:fatty acid amide hydrolase 2